MFVCLFFFICLFLKLPVDVIWRFSGVCSDWRSRLTHESFWACYCANKGWNFRKGLEAEAESEAKAEEKAKKAGYRKRKSYIAFIGLGPMSIRFWARKMFFKEQRDKMYDSAAMRLLRDTDLRMGYGQNVRGFLDCVLAVDPCFGPALNKRALLSFDQGDFESAKKGTSGSVLFVCCLFVVCLFVCFVCLFVVFLLFVCCLFVCCLFVVCFVLFCFVLFCFLFFIYLSFSDLEAALRHNPYYSDAISNLGLAYHELGLLEDACKMYTIALAIEGDEISFNNRGLCLNDLGQNERAIEDFMTILTILNPRYVDGFNNMAYSKNCLGRYEEAVIG